MTRYPFVECSVRAGFIQTVHCAYILLAKERSLQPSCRMGKNGMGCRMGISNNMLLEIRTPAKCHALLLAYKDTHTK